MTAWARKDICSMQALPYHFTILRDGSIFGNPILSTRSKVLRLEQSGKLTSRLTEIERLKLAD